MPDAVFLDTNVVRNTQPRRFFGNTEQLQQISRLAQIYIPTIVMEEIICQKRLKLQSSFSSFKGNYFFSKIQCEENLLEAHIEERLMELVALSKDEIDYILEPLVNDDTHLDCLKNMALQKRAPFELKADKGFKDAYIFLTIEQHLESTTDQVFLITNDGRLKDAYNNNGRVTVLKEPDDYFQARSGHFSEEYFLGTLSASYNEVFDESDDITLEAKHIVSAQITDDDEWKIEVKTDNVTFFAFVDYYSKEVI